MKEHIEYHIDSFKDFEGQVHHFVIAAVSVVDFCQHKDLGEYCGMETVNYYEYDSHSIDNIAKGLKIGISICNPCDEFNKEVGVKKAIARAKASETYALYATKKGYINTPMVKAFIKQEADYLKNNPSLYIKGYKEREEKYLSNKEMQGIYESLDKDDQNLVISFTTNPNRLNTIQKLLKWIGKK